MADIDQGWEGGATAVRKEILPVADRVVVRADWGGTGRAGGLETRSSLTVIHTVRDGQIVNLEYYFDHDAALEAVRLAE